MSQSGKRSQEERQLALARQQRALSSLPARKRMDAIIDSPEAAALVRAMPVLDLYATVSEVGLADAVELVQMATPMQFQGFVDLAAWRRDRLDSAEVLSWLRAARGEGEKDYYDKLKKLDLEILELVLREYVQVHDIEENPDVRLVGVPLETPEGRYLVEIHAEGIEFSAVRQVVTDLIADNPFEATRFFEALRWELPSELEHTAHQFRSARLEDLGFPPSDAASSLFAYAKPPDVRFDAPATRALSPLQRVDYFQAALAELDENELENLGVELRLLANTALVVEGADPGDLAAGQRVAEMVRDTLSLGLEHLSGARPEAAVEQVREHELRRIFQVGFSLTLKLKFRADRLARRPLARRGGRWFLFGEEAAALEALRSPRPRRALKVDGAEPVPFRSRAELEESAQILTRAEFQNEALVALLGESPEESLEALQLPEAQIEPEQVLAAAIAHALLSGAPRVSAIPSGRLEALGKAWVSDTSEGVEVKPAARERAREVLLPVVPESASPELSRLIDVLLDRVARELGRSLVGSIDPRTVSAVLPVAFQ